MFPVFFCLSLEKVDSQNQQLCGDTIVLYDLGYRSIRFGISFYTIRDIVLYDLEYRTIRFRESLSCAAKTRVMGGARPLAVCKPPPHVAPGHADGCLWRQQVSHLPMGFQVGRDVAFDYS